MVQFDLWLYQLFSSVPRPIQSLIPAAIPICSNSYFNGQKDTGQTLTLIFDLGWPEFVLEQQARLSMTDPHANNFFSTVSTRINRKWACPFHMTPSRYTEFALWCAKITSGAIP
jgi:hypothetical protein